MRKIVQVVSIAATTATDKSDSFACRDASEIKKLLSTAAARSDLLSSRTAVDTAASLELDQISAVADYNSLLWSLVN